MYKRGLITEMEANTLSDLINEHKLKGTIKELRAEGFTALHELNNSASLKIIEHYHRLVEKYGGILPEVLGMGGGKTMRIIRLRGVKPMTYDEMLEKQAEQYLSEQEAKYMSEKACIAAMKKVKGQERKAKIEQEAAKYAPIRAKERDEIYKRYKKAQRLKHKADAILRVIEKNCVKMESYIIEIQKLEEEGIGDTNWQALIAALEQNTNTLFEEIEDIRRAIPTPLPR